MSISATEDEIRPKALFDTYLALLASDIPRFFAASPRFDVPCPACGDSGIDAFTKDGFAYRECSTCMTLWQSPRPQFSAYADFYRSSESSTYWADVFQPAVEDARREKLWRPKARLIADLLAEDPEPHDNIVDIGGGNGVFAEEISAVTGCRVLVIEPGSASAAACRARGIDVIEAFAEEVEPTALPLGRTLFTTFELFEHVHSPREWLGRIADLMRPDDTLLLTTLSGLGLDIQVLWNESRAVTPPIHINFLNPSSIERLGSDVGLVAVRTFTPGVLDLDILTNNSQSVRDRFWASVLATADEDELRAWQQLIRDTKRSSHMWAVFRKP